MVLLQIIRDYLHWHYTRGVVDYVQVWGNFLHFFLNLFSISLLLRTLLSPWRRMTDDTEVHSTDLYGMFERGVINVTMRVIGFAVRTIFITIGLCMLALTLVIGLVGIVVWFVLPIGLLLLIIAGVQLLLFRNV